MNVLILQGELPHYRRPFFLQLAAVLGVNLTVACCVDHTSSRRSARDSLRVVVTPMRKMGPFHWHKGIWPVMKRCDVVVTMLDARWLSCMFTALLYGKKSVLWGHGFGKNTIANKVRLFIAKRAAAVLVYEESAKMAFVVAGCDPERIFVAGNTVEVRNPQRKDGKRSRFLYVGRLQARKRIEDIFLAFAHAQPSLPDTTMITIVGDGPIRRELELTAESLGITNRVEFAGAVYDEDELARHYASAIAYVSPGDVGLGILQSFGHGVPAITCPSPTHGPEFENMVDGVNGYICDDMNELGSSLIKLANDPALAESLGLNALNRYRSERTINDMVERVTDAINFVARRSSLYHKNMRQGGAAVTKGK